MHQAAGTITSSRKSGKAGFPLDLVYHRLCRQPGAAERRTGLDKEGDTGILPDDAEGIEDIVHRRAGILTSSQPAY